MKFRIRRYLGTLLRVTSTKVDLISELNFSLLPWYGYLRNKPGLRRSWSGPSWILRHAVHAKLHVGRALPSECTEANFSKHRAVCKSFKPGLQTPGSTFAPPKKWKLSSSFSCKSVKDNRAKPCSRRRPCCLAFTPQCPIGRHWRRRSWAKQVSLFVNSTHPFCVAYPTFPFFLRETLQGHRYRGQCRDTGTE